MLYSNGKVPINILTLSICEVIEWNKIFITSSFPYQGVLRNEDVKSSSPPQIPFLPTRLMEDLASHNVKIVVESWIIDVNLAWISLIASLAIRLPYTVHPL